MPKNFKSTATSRNKKNKSEMEKRLRNCLQSSAEEFLSSAAKLPLKSSKSTLKSLIHSIPPSSPLSSSLPLSIHRSVSESVLHFQNLLEYQHSRSPPSKRPRRSSRNLPKNDSRENESRLDKQRQVLEKLRILAYLTFLCVSHPKKPFSATDLFPAAQSLHDNLILFESDQNLSTEVASLCEECWKSDFPGREMLISQSLPFLVSRSLTLKKKVDVHRVYLLREAFALFDFEDNSIEDLKLLLMRCVIAPLYLKTEEGRRFLAFVFGLCMQLMKEALAMIKSQIPFGRKSILEAYGEILFRAWKDVEGEMKDEIENGFLQGLIESAIHAGSRELAASIRRILGGFLSQRVTDGVDKLLFRLAEPVIFRSLQVANSNVRLNALHLLLDFFPLEDPDATKEVKDMLLDKQFFLLEKLLMDDCPDIRIVAVEGCCRVLHLFWEIIPSPTIPKMLMKIINEMAHDVCSDVRLSTLNGIVYLLGNPQSHEILKVLLPKLGHLIFDNVISIRATVVDLLLLLRDIRTFQFSKVVGLEVLLPILADNHSQVARKITRLLMPSYFPSKVTIEEACNRCVTLIKRSPMGGARFCEHAAVEGASLKSLMELVKVLISLVLSDNKLDSDQTEGLLVAAAHICNTLVSEQCYRNNIKEFFSGGKVKCLFAAASTARAQSSVLDICSALSPEDMAILVEECMNLVTNCGGLSEDVDMQNEVRSAHKLLMSCDGFDGMFEALTGILQKAAYRCHVKFGTEIPKQRVSPQKRKKCKSSSKIPVKWKNKGGKLVSTFEEDYSVAVGVAWQIKDLVASEDNRKAILGSQYLELPFFALKVISEVSIVQCICCEYMDTSPILAYAALALHMTLQGISIGNINDCGFKKNVRNESLTTNPKQPTVLDHTADHLLNCGEKLLGAGEAGKSDYLPSASTPSNIKAYNEGERHGEAQRDSSGTNNDEKMSDKVKMLTTILKFIVDSNAMGFLSHIQGRCLSFSSAYVKHVILALGHHCSGKSQFKQEELKEIFLCLKSSFSYAAKLLNLILRGTSEASRTLAEAFDLAYNMLDLIASIELYLGSTYAGRLVATARSWLPDLVLALGSECMLKQSEAENMHLTALHRIRLNFPSWPLVLAKTELCEISEVNREEEDDKQSEPMEFPVLKKFMEMIVSRLKGNSNILDTIGVILLTLSIGGLERKDFGLVLGLLRFVCLKLVGPEDKEWSKYDMMLTCLPEIYPVIEKEIEEQSNEDEMQKLLGARSLLEPVWLYHIYETGRFSMTEE